jgi:Fe-S-cluster-containing hydrogenase component 2
MGEKEIIKVIADDCVGCETCVPECPAEAIAMVGDKAVIDQAKCTNCKTCIEACPVDAIKVQQ